MKKSYFKASFAVILSLLASISLLAQERVVSGKVTDASDGNPIPGANVVVKGTTSGTVTDIDGNYSISVSDETTLIFSFIGYASTEIPVGNRSTLDVSLELDIQSLSEVVVVGYGQQEKGDVTGVVAAVDADEFNKGAIVSPQELLTGKVAGVQITSNSGEPGGKSTIRIRGGTSITAGNEPLFVIDGVPITNDAHDPGGQSGGRNPLNFLNPSDIANITVLKDASAAAIYGSRGANGVVIITTKSGKKGDKARVTYDGYFSVAEMAGEINMLSADEFSNVIIAKHADKIGLIGDANTNWYDQITRRALGQNHNLSVSGGTDNAGYRVSVNHQDIEGVIKNSYTQRTGVSVNYNQSLLNDKLNITANLKSSYTKDRFDAGAVGSAIVFDPTQPVYDPGNRWGGYFEYDADLAPDNPVSATDQVQGFGEYVRNLGNIQVEYKLPIEGLSAKANLAYDVNFGERRRFQPYTLRNQSADSGEVRIEYLKRINPLMNFLLSYKKDLPSIQSSVDVTGGYEFQQFSSDFPSYRAYNLPTNVYTFYSANVAEESETFNFHQSNRIISFFGRLNYSLLDRYLLTATVRRDGSSRFGPDNQYGLFPSVALGWRLIDEPFMSGASAILSDLKLRASYGITGNQEFSNYQYLATYTPGQITAQYQFGNDFVSTVRPNGYDQGIKWEQTTSFNYGLDFGFFEGRLTGSVEYYEKYTDDLLFEVAVPAGTNLTNRIITNIGEVENKGIELALNGFIVDNADFQWTAGFNIAHNKNRIVTLDGSDSDNFEGFLTGGINGGTGNNIQILKVGEQVNSFYVYKAKLGEDGLPLEDGVDHNEDGQINLADIYEDTNGDETVNSEDRDIYKSPAPDLIMGLTSNMKYKGFDFSFTVRSNVGGYVYNNIASSSGFYNGMEGATNWLQNVHTSVLETNYSTPQYFSDYYVEDASFVRIDNISLGYSIKQLKQANIRVYGTVQNAFVLTGYSGLDPEVGGGIDNNPYPRARTFLLGLSLGF